MDPDDKKLLEFARDFGAIQATQENAPRIHRLVNRGLLERSGKRYRLTETGKSAISN
jgi:predicted transcriptional regulator